MDTLFGYLLSSPQVYFSDFSKTRIGWSTKDFALPGRGGTRGLRNDQAFEAMMRHFSLVVYNRQVIQCSMPLRSAPNEEVVLRKRISDAFGESLQDAEPELYTSD